VRGTLQGMPRSVARGMPFVCQSVTSNEGELNMEDRTDIIETTPTPPAREVHEVNRVPKSTTEYRSVERPAVLGGGGATSSGS